MKGVEESGNLTYPPSRVTYYLSLRRKAMLHRRTTTRYESKEWSMNAYNNGSHMPLDTHPHWSWENPLILFPLLIVFLTALALLALIF